MKKPGWLTPLGAVEMDRTKTYRVDTAHFDRLLKARRVRVPALAERAGFDASTVRNVSEGISYLLNVFRAIAEAIGVPVRDLHLTESEEPTTPAEFAGYRSVVLALEEPAYFCDGELILQECNPGFESLMGVGRDELLGRRSVTHLIDIFSQRLPASERAAYLERQRDVVRRTMRGEMIDITHSVVVDNRDLPEGRYHGVFQVTVAGGPLLRPKTWEHLGSLIRFRVDPCDSHGGAALRDRLPPPPGRGKAGKGGVAQTEMADRQDAHRTASNNTPPATVPDLVGLGRLPPALTPHPAAARRAELDAALAALAALAATNQTSAVDLLTAVRNELATALFIVGQVAQPALDAVERLGAGSPDERAAARYVREVRSRLGLAGTVGGEEEPSHLPAPPDERLQVAVEQLRAIPGDLDRKRLQRLINTWLGESFDTFEGNKRFCAELRAALRPLGWRVACPSCPDTPAILRFRRSGRMRMGSFQFEHSVVRRDDSGQHFSKQTYHGSSPVVPRLELIRAPGDLRNSLRDET